MQRAGEQQEAEEAPHQGLVEIDVRQEFAKAVLQRPSRDHGLHGDDDERAGQGDDERAAGCRKPQESMIQVAKDRGDRQQHRGDVEGVHRAILPVSDDRPNNVTA